MEATKHLGFRFEGCIWLYSEASVGCNVVFLFPQCFPRNVTDDLHDRDRDQGGRKSMKDATKPRLRLYRG